MARTETGKHSRVGLLVVVAGLLAAVAWLLKGGGPEAVVPASDAGGAGQALLAGELRSEPELLLAPRLADRASIAGTIRDSRGQPIAGAQVCAFARSDLLAGSDARRPSCATSGRDGHYRIDGLFAVRQRVTAGAPGFIPGVYARGEGTSRRETVDLRPGMEAREIDIALEDGGVEIHGVVKDLSGGPIEGAQVGGEAAFTTTGAEGVFAMWVRPGEAYVWAQAEGYAFGRDAGAAPGHFFEVFLTPEAVLVGKVVRAGEGSPIEGARVTATAGSGFNWASGSAFTDAGGNFRIDGLEPGVYKPRAEADEAMGLAQEQVILGLGETSAPIVIEAHPAFLVAGTIVIEGGGSCDSGTVNLRDAGNDRRGSGRTEPDGSVRVRGLLPGEYQVNVSCPGYVSAERYERVTITDKSVSGLRWTVSPGQAIRGVVVDAAGKPVEKMWVRASAKADPGLARAQQTNAWGVESDAQGRFELAGLIPGSYEVSLSAGEIPRAAPAKPTPVTLPKGQDVEGLRIELPATGEVRGEVRDPQGRPVARASVGLSGGAQNQSVSAADDGSFHFAQVAAGEYRAIARRGVELLRAPGTGDDDVQGEKVEVRAGKTETVKLVVEGPSGTITGVVRDEDGGPVADAFVEALRESERAGAASGQAIRQGRWSSLWEKPHLTDVDGRFSLEQLSPGKHTIRAHRKGGGEAILEHVAVGSEAVLTIAAAGRMAGTVSVRGAAVPEEFSVRLRDESTGYQRNDRFYRTGGAWSLPEVPAGKYKVSVNCGAGSAEVEATMSAGKDTTDVRVELAPKVTVRGRVVDLEGKPVAGLEASIGAGGFGGGGDERRLHVTDESGRFEVANVPGGKVRVSLWPRNWGGDSEYDRVDMPAVIPDDAGVFELPEIRVARRQVKTGEAQGDLGYRLMESEPGEDPLKRKLVVAFVRPNSPAAQAGIQVGDEIVSVDGHDVTGPNMYLHSSLTRVLEGTVVTLGLARGASVQVTAGKKP